MRPTTTSRRYLLLGTALTAALSLGACGGSDGSNDADSADTGGATPTSPGGGDGEGDGGDLPGSGVDFPDLGQHDFNTGRIHLEMSGDQSVSIEIDGIGSTTDGFLNAVFRDDNRAALAIFGLSSDGATVSFTMDGISSGGNFGTECSMDLTKADESGVQADFTCHDMPGYGTDSTTLLSIDAEGSFTLAP